MRRPRSLLPGSFGVWLDRSGAQGRQRIIGGRVTARIEFPPIACIASSANGTPKQSWRQRTQVVYNWKWIAWSGNSNRSRRFL